MSDPRAEVDLHPGLVRALLREQVPALADRPLELLANGWDNTLFRLGDDLVVRLPRREAAAELVHNEQLALPAIAGRVSVTVPVPVVAGRPGPGYPWSWSVMPWLEGTPAYAERPSDQVSFGRDLAGFLRELQVEAPVGGFPLNPVRGVALSKRDRVVRARLQDERVPHRFEALALWERAVAAPVWQGAPRWLHGDVHPANLLVRGGALSAVIDFGDVTAGDPATDLSTAWLSLDADGRAAFRQGLDFDDATWQRAAGWAVSMASAFITMSSAAPAMIDVGHRALDALFAA